MAGSPRNSSLCRVASSMSSFNRRSFLLSLAALTGCGFTPAYGPNGTASKLRGAVTIDAAASREGFNLFNALQARFGPPSAPKYRLEVSVQTREDDVGVTRDGEITRYHVVGTARYTLTDLASGEIAADGSVQSFTAYSATRSTVASLTSTRDAYARLMDILAAAIENDLMLKLSR